jgi:hypothetical protein
MIKYLTVFFLSLFLISCKKEAIKNTELELPPREISIDTTDGEKYIAILQLDKSKNTVNLSDNEIKIIENLLRKQVENYNGKFDKKRIDLKYYKRQYFPQVDENGDKLVGIFCFCSVEDNDKWKTQAIVNPYDGGKCYFHVTINVTKKTVIHFQTNGEA